jgi:hypothetical protein
MTDGRSKPIEEPNGNDAHGYIDDRTGFAFLLGCHDSINSFQIERHASIEKWAVIVKPISDSRRIIPNRSVSS